MQLSVHLLDLPMHLLLRCSCQRCSCTDLAFVLSLNTFKALNVSSEGMLIILSWLAPPILNTGDGDNLLKISAQADTVRASP
jgi:hypothetical protein